MARFQIGEALKAGDKRIKHVVRFFEEIENPHIKRDFFEKYGAAYHLPEPPIPSPIVSPFEGASENGGSPFEATVTVTNTGTSVPSERAPAAPRDEERELFARGREVLGKNAGGQIAKLLKAKGGIASKARAAIEQAASKDSPSEYIAAAIRGGAGPPAFPQRSTNGFATILYEFDREDRDHASSNTVIDVTPNQPR